MFHRGIFKASPSLLSTRPSATNKLFLCPFSQTAWNRVRAPSLPPSRGASRPQPATRLRSLIGSVKDKTMAVLRGSSNRENTAAPSATPSAAEPAKQPLWEIVPARQVLESRRKRVRAKHMYSKSNLRIFYANMRNRDKSDKPLEQIRRDRFLDPPPLTANYASLRALKAERTLAPLPTQPLPNTRGDVREQLCRTPFMKTSLKKLNLLAKLIHGKDLKTAMLHMMFCKKKPARETLWALHTGARIGRDVQKMRPSRMYVAWASIGRGEISKKYDIRGRGRAGRIRSPEAHMIIMLREKTPEQMAQANRKQFKPRVPRPSPEKRILHARIAV